MSEQCVELLRKNIKGLRKPDAEKLARELDRRAKALADENSVEYGAAMDQAVKDVTAEYVRISKVQRRNRAKDKLTTIRAYKWITKSYDKDPAKGLESFMVGTEIGIGNSRNSVGGHAYTEAGWAGQAFVGALTRADVLADFRARSNELPIAKAIDARTKGESVQGIPKNIVKIADIIMEHAEIARKNYNNKGGDIKKLDGWRGPQSHNSNKIEKAGLEAWTAVANDTLDWDRTFKGVPKDEQQKLLSELYDRFSKGDHIKVSDPEGSGSAQIAKSMGQHRVLHFKSPEAALAYHKEFGYGTVADGFLSYLTTTAHKAAVMDRLGPNARGNYDRLVTMLENKYSGSGKGKPITNKAKEIDRLYWPFIDNSANVPASDIGATVGATVRAVETLSKLGGAAISAFGDLAFSSAEGARQGASFYATMGDQFAGIFKGVNNATRYEILSEIQVSLDGLIASAATRFNPSNVTEPGAISKSIQLFMKANLLQSWTDRQRAAFAIGMSHRLGLNAKHAHADMNDEMRQILSLYDINKPEWELIRNSGFKELDGKAYLVTEGVQNASDESIIRYLKSTGVKEPTPFAIREARDKVTRSLRLAFNDRMDHAVIEGDLKTRGMLLQGTQAGTIMGEGVRSLMLFKTFSATVLQKAMGADLFGKGTETTWSGAFRNMSRNGAMKSMAHTMVVSGALGYLSMSAKDMLKGLEPRVPDPDDPASFAKIFTASMLQGGGLGIYGDFLFGDLKNRFGGTPLSSVAGPVFGSGDDIVTLINNAVRGDAKASSAIRLIENHFPGGNLFYVKPILDRMLWWQAHEHYSPGYTGRMERRLLKEQDQNPSDFLFGSPTSGDVFAQ